MKRLSALVLLAVVLIAIPAWAEEFSAGLTKISEHVYGYVGITQASPAENSFGANSGVVVGKDAVLVVDTLVSAKQARKLIEDIKKVTDKPVKYVVNTHYHLDHAWGNSEFVKIGAVVIGQENGRLMGASRAKYGIAHPEEFGMTGADLEGTVAAPPTVTFKNSMLVDLGDVTVTLSYFGAAHTTDSIVAMVDPDKVLFVGDILFTQYHPFLGEGDIPHWKQVLADLDSMPAAVIVPGHGPISTSKDIKDMSAYLSAFDALALKLCQGKTKADAAAIADEILKALPEQGRTELPSLVGMNLQVKYLPPETVDKISAK